MKRLWWWLVGIVVLIGIVIIVILMVAPKSPIKPSLVKQLTSTLLVPTGVATIDASSESYDAQKKLLVYNVSFGGTKVVISEQPTPEQFTDIPQVYTKVIQDLNNYTTFDVNVGTVYLTKPKELAGKQTAVINTKGTLLFAKPDANLTDDQWRKFFTHMSVGS